MCLPNLSVFSSQGDWGGGVVGGGGENYICEFRNESRRILVNTECADQFLRLFVN